MKRSVFGLLVCTPLVAASAIPSVGAAGELTAIFSEDQYEAHIAFMDASCSDNPECLIARVSCDGGGIKLDLIGVNDATTGDMLKDGTGARLLAGRQSVSLLPTTVVFDELNGGWDVTLASWRSGGGEEAREVVEAMSKSPLRVEELALSAALVLPTDEGAIEQQRNFSDACIKM